MICVIKYQLLAAVVVVVVVKVVIVVVSNVQFSSKYMKQLNFKIGKI